MNIFAGDYSLAAILRPSDIDASSGCLPYVARIVARTQNLKLTQIA
ncbi:hypothetical protein [Fimbriiglobus ruber]